MSEKAIKYIYKIGETIETKTGKIKILQETRVKNGNTTRKGYVYECFIDGDIDTISESDLKKRNGCKVCSGRKILKGYNDIATTHPYLVKYFVNTEDAYKYSHGSEQKVFTKCPDCNIKKEIIISNLCKRGFKCDICSSNKSIGEKTMFNILTQLNIKFEKEIVFIWSKNIQVSNVKLCGYKRYDFYFELNNEGYIIETHGMQHYEEGFERTKNKKCRTFKEEQENDKIKKKLALNSGVKEENYIVIDCRYTDFIFIRNNILNSELNELFNLSEICWDKCLDSLSISIVKKISEMWNSVKDINRVAKDLKMNRNTVRDKLKVGTLLKFTDYDAEEEIVKRNYKSINTMTCLLYTSPSPRD